MIKLLRPSPRLLFSWLQASERWMLVAGRAEGPTRKKKPPGLIKKKRPSRLPVSLLPQQKLTSLQAEILEEKEEIIAINNQVVQPPVPWPPVQTQLILPLLAILVMIEIDY